MSYPKFYIGPMSKNIVDTIIDFANETNNKIGLIPSRRQIEYNGGYVNNWETEDFSLYVRTRSKNIILQRDHAGADQGGYEDNGYDSLRNDAWQFDLIHIDPWKKYHKYTDGLRETADMITYVSVLNPHLKFEVGTEESIRRFDSDELDEFVTDLHFYLGAELFKKIVYLVIQSGTSLRGNTQVGYYDKMRLKKMIQVCKKHNLLSKEHNGDYIQINTINEKFKLGLDSINIAPEFGLIETKTYLKYLTKEMFDDFFEICYKSRKWEKWVYSDFNPMKNKDELVRICGHYVLSDSEFLEKIKNKLPKTINIDTEIKNNVRIKLNELYG